MLLFTLQCFINGKALSYIGVITNLSTYPTNLWSCHQEITIKPGITFPSSLEIVLFPKNEVGDMCPTGP